MNGETKKVDQKKFFKRFVLCQGTLKLIKNSFRRKNRSILTCGQVNSGLPKAEGFSPSADFGCQWSMQPKAKGLAEV